MRFRTQFDRILYGRDFFKIQVLLALRDLSVRARTRLQGSAELGHIGISKMRIRPFILQFAFARDAQLAAARIEAYAPRVRNFSIDPNVVVRLIVLLACLCCSSCAERPVFGIELGTQRIQDCVPGSMSKPCP